MQAAMVKREKNVIEFKDVCKTYENGTEALSHVNFKIEKGEFVFIVGPSGSGKSTLAKLLMYEEKATSGEIRINDYHVNELRRRDVPYLRRSMGVVFQDFRLLQDRTVYDNIMFAMQVVGATKKEIRRRIPTVLSAVGLTHKARSYPDQLSGGEQQRVSLARALANNPPLLIADEPTANLNPSTAMEIVEILEQINDRGTTVIMATHAKEIVDRFQKRVITIADGRLVRDCEKGGYDDGKE
jgi:cell division transport system ATP-binding protein